MDDGWIIVHHFGVNGLCTYDVLFYGFTRVFTVNPMGFGLLHPLASATVCAGNRRIVCSATGRQFCVAETDWKYNSDR